MPIIFILLTGLLPLFAEERFPPPDFDNPYNFPQTQLPLHRDFYFEYIDILLLAIFLFTSTYLIFKKRRRMPILVLAFLSLIYFGFIREGCVCPVGSTQNIASALFFPTASVSLSVLIIFTLPLIFSLFFGRVFCSSVCPFGAFQDLIGGFNVKLPPLLNKILSFLPIIVLAIAVVFASSAGEFLICRFDPFVPIFRRDGTSSILFFTAVVIITSIFINRAFCRFLCPYGVILSIFSAFSKNKLEITSNCISCTICYSICPTSAISKKEVYAPHKKRINRIIKILLLSLPISLIFSLSLSRLSPVFTNITYTGAIVSSIREVKNPEDISFEASKALEEYTREELLLKEKDIDKRMKLSLFIAGLIISSGIITVLIKTLIKKEVYKIDSSLCVMCLKCVESCPENRSGEIGEKD